MTDREAAWSAIHDRLPAGWRVGPPTFAPGTRPWEVAAIGPRLGRRQLYQPPPYVVGMGADELAALEELARRLAGPGEP